MKDKIAKRVRRTNYYGKPPGHYTTSKQRRITVRYSKDGMRIQCVAYTHKAARQCRNWSEPFKDKCRMHGGRAPIKSGKYSKYKVEFLKKVKEFANSPNLKSLSNEIGILRALLMNQLQKITEQGDFNPGNEPSPRAAALLAGIIEPIRRSVETLVKIEDGMRLTLDIPDLKAILEQIVQIIHEEVKDHNITKRIAERFETLAIPNARSPFMSN